MVRDENHDRRVVEDVWMMWKDRGKERGFIYLGGLATRVLRE